MLYSVSESDTDFWAARLARAGCYFWAESPYLTRKRYIREHKLNLLTVLLNVEPGLVDDDAAVGGEDLHGDPQRPGEDEEPDGEAARRHQQRPLVQVEAEAAPPEHRRAIFSPFLSKFDALYVTRFNMV